MTKVQDEWRLAIEETATYARRYRWLRSNLLPFFNEMSPEELDAEIDTRSGVVPTGTMAFIDEGELASAPKTNWLGAEGLV